MTRANELPAAIQWHEGMLLAPQHFQQLSLRQERLLHYHASHLAPFHYGVIRLRLDNALLLEGTIRVLELEAILPELESAESADAAAKVLADAGFETTAMQADISDRAMVQAVARKAQELGPIKALVQAAGVSPSPSYSANFRLDESALSTSTRIAQSPLKAVFIRCVR